ncbi:toll/interleukin-1 receptor domain-containing protein [Qipengyuania sp. 6B39]|uniref:toll/interleukin-1 receptor domain-containing protein n=1 Tax=Qipengyuania proteolytica TaxID=2867239 RepID=UPI001C8925A3|nr:toll/interleukin-1 receptor domain-containing protein [Qipengyuania proteolytica]MBX7494882.1 toll/interleukin-1 receptor domain-containing protein [Qipengyuania proteolytica]
MEQRRYKAFLSYSHRDREVAEWLHERLESYRLPEEIAEDGEGLRPIFKDREELPASQNLGAAIESALAASEALIVLCSPAAAVSPWIAREIELFRAGHGDDRIFLAVVDGEPPYNIPPALLVRHENGEPTDDTIEPVAADLRPQADGRKLGMLKLAAGLAGVGLDRLVNREAHRRHRRMAVTAGASFAGMVVAIALALFVTQQRDVARAERAEANGLVEYMLTDLREQLEPVGRLDLLDGVGSRALDYYARQKIENLTPDELGRRVKAVQLVAEVQNLRGKNDVALPAVREAARTTGELLARSPDDPERLFDHGQSLYWVGYLAWQRGELAEAKRALGEYAAISQRLARRDPKNLTWQMEESYALSNLGTLAVGEGRYEDALPQFERSVEIVEGVAEAEGRPAARVIELGEGLSWVATTRQYLADFAGSARIRREEIALYREVLAKDPNNYDARRMAIFARQRMGWLLALSGKRGEARSVLDLAAREADAVIRHDPENTVSREVAIGVFLERGFLNWREGKVAAATSDFDRTQALVDDLRKRDPEHASWNVERPAGLQLARALTDRADQSPAALKALAARWLEKLDPDDPDHVWPIVAAHIVEALANARSGDPEGEATAYARALAVDDRRSGFNINATALRAVAAERLGQKALATRLRARFRAKQIDPAIDDRIAGA